MAIRMLDKALILIDSKIELTTVLIGHEHCGSLFGQQKDSPKTVQWTGNIVDLVELSEAILEAKVINNGNITRLEFYQKIGEFMNVRISNSSRTVIDICNRVKGERTPFLDFLKKIFIAKLAKMDNKPSRK